jgi:hypothetical protein
VEVRLSRPVQHLDDQQQWCLPLEPHHLGQRRHIGTLAEGALATVASFDGAAAPQADATAANLTLLTNCIVSTFAAPTVTGANAAAPPLVEDYRSRPIA